MLYLPPTTLATLTADSPRGANQRYALGELRVGVHAMDAVDQRRGTHPAEQLAGRLILGRVARTSQLLKGG